MSRFFSDKYADLVPYVPGEQPKDRRYIKLNTNESPFPPPDGVVKAATAAAKNLNLYSAPEPTELYEKYAAAIGVKPTQLIATNGSDEVLDFAFKAFCDKDHPAVFPDITYGFYEVFAKANGVPAKIVPLSDDFTVNVDAMVSESGTLFIANPNAPTGIALPLSEIERIVASDPSRVVVVDEAYVDFGAQSAVGLIEKYDNLLITQTFSKSRSLAGARLGFGIACESLIADLKTIKYSTNPYNVNSVTQAAGCAAIDAAPVFIAFSAIIQKDRELLTKNLEKLGFELTPSAANFVFAKHPKIDGRTLYLELKKRGVLIRHFDTDRIKDYNRITVGCAVDLGKMIDKIKKILEERT